MNYEGSLNLNNITIKLLDIKSDELYRLSVGDELFSIRTKGINILKRIKELNCSNCNGKIISVKEI